MWDHHRRTIDRLTQRFSTDPCFPALIVGGSLVKGYGRPDSDVDIILIATDEEYAQRLTANQLHYFSTEDCDYPGGYVDGKIVDVQFLRDAADRGSEPARAAFRGAFLAYCRNPEVEHLLQLIPIYPEEGHIEKVRSFIAQLLAWQWYVGEADKLANTYLMHHAVSELLLYGGRLILAHNRILYPYHKWFMTELRGAPELPEGFLGYMEDLLAQPSKAAADQYCECILGFQTWERPPEGWPARFMFDTEWTWRTGRVALPDC
jgi:hypothetical protein